MEGEGEGMKGLDSSWAYSQVVGVRVQGVRMTRGQGVCVGGGGGQLN